MKFARLAVLAAAGLLLATAAQAETRVTLKSATAGSSYYQMTVQLGEALKSASNGQITATVEESQGSVQNVKEAPKRTGNYIFTSPPSLVKDAQAQLDEAAVIEWAKDRMANYKVPRSVIFLDELPMNAGGKVDKAVLIKQSLQAQP